MRIRLGSAGMIAGAMVSVLVCYTVSLRVSAERGDVDALRGQIASNMKDIRALEAELKTRARLPQLQRWNDNVLALSAPTAKQYVNDSVQLASFAPNPPAVPAAVLQAPTTQLAVATDASPIVPQRPTGLVTVAYTQPAVAMPAMMQPTVVTPRQLIEATRPRPAPAVTQEAAKPAVEKKPVVAAAKPAKPEVKLAKAEPSPAKPQPVRTAEAKPAKRVDPLGDLIGDIDGAAAAEVRNAGGAL